jgi:hypothetical protein
MVLTVFAEIPEFTFKNNTSPSDATTNKKKYILRNDSKLFNDQGIIGTLNQKIMAIYDKSKDEHRNVNGLNIDLEKLGIDILTFQFVSKSINNLYPIGQSFDTTVQWSNVSELIGTKVTYAILDNGVIQLTIFGL